MPTTTYDLYCNAPGHAGRSADRGYTEAPVWSGTAEPTAEQEAAPHYCDACAVALLGKILPEIPSGPEPDPV